MAIKDINDKKEWENFFYSFERRTFLNSWSWGNFRKSIGNKVWRKAVITNEKIESLFLVSRVDSKKGSFLLLSHCPASLLKEAFKESIEEVISMAKKEKVSFVRIAPILGRGSFEEGVLNDLGFRISPSSVFPIKSLELDLTLDEDLILSGMRKSTRYLIKQGLKDESIKVSISKDLSDLDLFYNLQTKTASRQGFKPFSRDYLRKEFEAFSTDDQVALVLGYHEGECVAGAFIIFWGERAFYHHGASLSVSNKVSVSHLVQWEAIKEAKRRGCKKYNFWAISPFDDPNHKWAGLTRFKKGFGGEEIEYADTRDLPISKRYLLTYWFERMKGLME